MALDTLGDCPAALVARMREAAENHALTLVADTPPPLLPTWIEQTIPTARLLHDANVLAAETRALVLTSWIDPKHLDAAIARLRDLLIREVFVLHPGNVTEQARQMGALGLRCLTVIHAQQQSWGLNHFSPKSYKPTPDWLNSRHWANPQLWNKHRW